MGITRTFQIVAVLLLFIAVYFLWQQNRDGIFLSVVLAACSYFISFRMQAKARVEAHQREREEDSLE